MATTAKPPKTAALPAKTAASPAKTAASPLTTTAALRPALAAVVPELVTGVVEFHFPGAPAHLPLKVTPPLEGGPYVFPVTGEPVWGDTYGAPRSDVPGGWHHGDDIFAMLGTPVVAVADGTVNRVGWERLGGWRLWVRDRAGDEFYYAHLSGYSKLALRSTRVKAGEVIGFIGNTGDAFTTVPHLHFEVHPRTLLHLGYDGAVDPTGYLRSWRQVGRFTVGRPVHPPLPTTAAWRAEAKQNFRELLNARGLTHHFVLQQPAGPASRSSAHVPASAVAMPLPAPARPVAASGGRPSSWPLLAALIGLVAVSAAVGWGLWRRAHRPAAGGQ